MDELEKYYNYLRQHGADVPDTYQSFRTTLQDENSARKYYDYLRTNKFDTPDSFDSFSNTFGLKKKVSGQVGGKVDVFQGNGGVQSNSQSNGLAFQDGIKPMIQSKWARNVATDAPIKNIVNEYNTPLLNKANKIEHYLTVEYPKQVQAKKEKVLKEIQDRGALKNSMAGAIHAGHEIGVEHEVPFNPETFVDEDIRNNGLGIGGALEQATNAVSGIDKNTHPDLYHANLTKEFIKNRISSVAENISNLEAENQHYQLLKDDRYQPKDLGLLDRFKSNELNYAEKLVRANEVSEQLKSEKDKLSKLIYADDYYSKKYANLIGKGQNADEKLKAYTNVSNNPYFKKLQTLRGKGIPIKDEDKLEQDRKKLEIAYQELEDEYKDIPMEDRDKEGYDYWQRRTDIENADEHAIFKYPELVSKRRAAIISQKLPGNGFELWAMATSGSENAMKMVKSATGLTEEEISKINPSDIKQSSMAGEFFRPFINSATGVLRGATRVIGSYFGVDKDRLDVINDNTAEFGDWITQHNPNEEITKPEYIVGNNLELMENPDKGKLNLTVGSAKNFISSAVGNLASFIGGTKLAGSALALGDRAGMYANIIATGWEDRYKNADNFMPNESEWKKNLYSLLTGATEAAVFEFLPKEKLGIKATKQEMQAFYDATKNATVKTVNKDLLKGWVQKVLEGAGKSAGEAGKVQLASSSADIANAVIRSVFADKSDAKNNEEELKKKLSLAHIGEGVLSLAIGLGAAEPIHNARTSFMRKTALYDMGLHPTDRIADISQAIDRGEISEADGKKQIELVETMKNIVASIPETHPSTNKPLTEGQKIQYADNRLREVANKAKAEGVKDDPALTEYYKKNTKELADERKAIIEGTHQEYLDIVDLHDRVAETGKQKLALSVNGTKVENMLKLAKGALDNPSSMKLGDEMSAEVMALLPKEDLKASLKEINEGLKDGDRFRTEAQLNSDKKIVDDAIEIIKKKNEPPPKEKPIDKTELPKNENIIGEVNSDEISKPIELSVDTPDPSLSPNIEPKTEQTGNVAEILKNNVNLQSNEKANTKTDSAGQNESGTNNPPKPEKEKTLTEKVSKIQDVTDPHDRVLQYFSGEGKIHSSAINELFGGKDSRIRQSTSTEGEKRARISLLGKDAPSIDRLAHDLWESDLTGKYDTQDYKNAIEEVLGSYNSKSSMQQALVDKYDFETAAKKYYEQHYEPEAKQAIDITEKLTDDEINEILNLHSDETRAEQLEHYLETLIEKDVTAIPQENQVKEEAKVPDSKPVEGGDRDNEHILPKEESNAKEGVDKAVGEGEMTGITHAQTDAAAREFGLDEYAENPETIKEWDAEVDKRIAENPNAINEMLTKYRNREKIDKYDQRMMLKYFAHLKAKVNESPTSENLKQLTEAKRLSDIEGGREVAKSLVARKGFSEVKEINDLALYLEEEANSSQVETLPQRVIDELKQKYEANEKVVAQLNARIEKLEQQAAEKEIEKQAKKTAKSDKTPEYFKEQRKTLAERLKKQFEDFKNETQKTGIVDDGYKQFELTVEMAKTVKDFIKTYLDEGLTKLSELVEKVHDEIKGIVPGISQRDIRDVIAGKYAEKKQTRNEIAEQLRNLKTEQVLIDKIEKLENGEKLIKDPIRKQKATEEIQALRDKLKELDEPNKPADEQKLQSYKTGLKNKIAKLKKDLETGDYLKEPEPPKPLKLDAEAIRLKDEHIKFVKETALRRAKNEWENRSKGEKIYDNVMQVLGLKRIVQTAIDLSIPFRQGVTIAFNPRRWTTFGKSFTAMMQSVFSPKTFDRIMFDIHKSADYKDMLEDKVHFNEMDAVDSNQRNEDFQKSFAYKIPIIREPLLASNRAADAFLNVSRQDMYMKGKRMLERQGITRDNSPEHYEALGKWVMNITGRGNMVKFLEDSHAGRMIASNTFFGARLMASRFNLLNPAYYVKMPKEVRVEAMKDMATFTGMLIATGLAGMAAGGTVSFDPDDAEFLKLKFGNTKYDLSGGLSQYVRTYLRLSKMIGIRFSHKPKEEKDKYAKFAIKSTGDFFRYKLAPNTSYLFSAAIGKDPLGRDFDPTEALKIYPMYVDDIVAGYKESGMVSLATILVPSILGVGVQTYESKKDYSDAELKSPSIKFLKERGIEPPQIGSKKQVDKDNEMTDEQYETFVKNKKDIMLKAMERLRTQRFRAVDKDENGIITNVRYVTGEQLDDEQLKEELSKISADATSKAKQALRLTPKAKTEVKKL